VLLGCPYDPALERGRGENPPSPPTPFLQGRALSPRLPRKQVPGGQPPPHTHPAAEVTPATAPAKPTQDKRGFEILPEGKTPGGQPSKVGRWSGSIIFYSSLDCSYYKISCRGPQMYGTSGKLSKEHKLVFPFKELCKTIPY